MLDRDWNLPVELREEEIDDEDWDEDDDWEDEEEWDEDEDDEL